MGMDTMSAVFLALAVAAAARSVDLHARDCKIHIWEKVAYALFLTSSLCLQLAR